MKRFFYVINVIKRFFYKFSPEVRKVKKWRANYEKENFDERAKFKISYKLINDCNDCIDSNYSDEYLKQFCENFISKEYEEGFCANFFCWKKENILNFSRSRLIQHLKFVNAI